MAKNPWIAAGLSFVLAGLGQIYVGQTVKGLLFLALDLATGYVMLHVHEGAGLVLNLVIGTISIVDAFQAARKTRGEVQSMAEPALEREIRVF